MMRKDGTSIIFIQYCHSLEKRTILNSGIAIPPSYWNLKRLRISGELPVSFGSHEFLNERLQNAIRIVEDILIFAEKNKMKDPLLFLKKTFKPDLDISLLKEKGKEIETPKVNLDVFFQIDEYIKSKERHVTPKMILVYKNMRETLKLFENYRKKPITFESFDFNFYEEFIDYMMYEHIQRRRKEIIKGFRVSTVGKIIKQLRIFLRNRMRRKLIPHINLEDFKILDEETDAIYLTRDEINCIYNTDLSGFSHLNKYRDLLVFGCLTGMRFSDFSSVKPEDVRDRMLYKKQKKSERWVVIPLRDEAYDIYINKFKRHIPVITNADFNYYIKEVAKIAGIVQNIKFSHKKGNQNIVIIKSKYNWVTSHTCRRSFCTNEFLDGTPVELIMKISGHRSLRDFYKYIRITPEEAGQKIMKIWESRGEVNTIVKG